MESFHDEAVYGSAALFLSEYRQLGFTYKNTSDGPGPDLEFCIDQNLAGTAEVKTLAEKKRVQLFAELFGRGKFRHPLPTGSGCWGAQVSDDSKLDKGVATIQTHFAKHDSLSGEQVVRLELEVSKFGFRHLANYPDSTSDELILSVSPSVYSPMENGIDAKVLVDFFHDAHNTKGAVQAVRQSKAPHRHIFLWPWEDKFPAEVHAAREFPSVVPRRLERLPQGFTGLWIGHSESLAEGQPKGWFFSENMEWKLVEARPDATEAVKASRPSHHE